MGFSFMAGRRYGEGRPLRSFRRGAVDLLTASPPSVHRSGLSTRIQGRAQKGRGIMAITKSEALKQVQTMVAEVTRARFEGGAYAKLARAHGYADGYMKALLDLGIVERGELLKAIGDERGRVVAGDLEPKAA
jgi:hypothetical protein